jgi:hypothetical protein
MKPLEEIRKNGRISIQQIGEDGGAGYIYLGRFPFAKFARIVFSWGDGWDHVSVSFSDRCPTWEEMCMAKDVFFREDECVVQYHPAKSDYVNRHLFCLHLWKPQDAEIPKPPKYMVG